MNLVLEVSAEDAASLAATRSRFPTAMRVTESKGIDGSEWLTFIITMTSTVGPLVVEFLKAKLAERKKVIVVVDGERRELTDEELGRIAELSRAPDEG